MPSISCPVCGRAIPVVVSQAGSEVTCSACQRSVAIPKLGELRRLEAEQSGNSENAVAKRRQSNGEANATRRLCFAGATAIAFLAALIGLFCLVRWALIQVPANTEIHVAEVNTMFHQVGAAQLVREWQQMEKYGLELTGLYGYKKMEIEKSTWANYGLISLAVFLLASGLATVLGIGDAKSKAAANTATSHSAKVKS